MIRILILFALHQRVRMLDRLHQRCHWTWCPTRYKLL